MQPRMQIYQLLNEYVPRAKPSLEFGKNFLNIAKIKHIHNHTYRKMRSVAGLDGTNLRPGAWRTGLPNSLVCGAVRWPMALSGVQSSDK